MTYDIKTEWTCPSINEVFLLTEDNVPKMKVKCVEGTGGEEECSQLLIKKLNFFILFLTKIDNFLK